MRRLSFNMLSSVIYRVAIILTGLAVQRYILSCFGSEINGLTSGIAQILSYLVLLEAGIGAATVSSLRGPLAENDTNRVSRLLAESGRMYRRAGLVFLALLALLSALLPFLIEGSHSPITVAFLTAFGGMGSLISYLTVGKYTPLLTADGRLGFLYLTDTLNALISCGARIYLMSAGADIVAVQAVLPICAALRAIAVAFYVKHRYNAVNPRVTPSDELKKIRRSAMTHQVVGLVVAHTDVTLLTLLSSLKNVSLYSVYSYIYNSISTMLEALFSQTVIAPLGKKAAEGQESFNSAFLALQAIYNAILYLFLTVALILTLPFISVYTAGIDDMEYTRLSLAVLFCLGAFLNLLRLPSIVTVNVYGYFKETEKSAVLECAINLGLSLLLFPFLGIHGLLLGTVAAYLFRTQDTVRFVYKKCGLSYQNLLRANIGNLLASAAVILLFFVFFPVTAGSVAEWVLKAFCITVISALIFAAINLIFNGAVFKKLIRPQQDNQ